MEGGSGRVFIVIKRYSLLTAIGSLIFPTAVKRDSGQAV
jgi:hypothetical protein